MGNEIEKAELIKKHNEELRRIMSINDDNIRKKEVEEICAKYNLIEKIKDLENFIKRDKELHSEKIKQLKSMHEEKMKQLKYEDRKLEKMHQFKDMGSKKIKGYDFRKNENIKGYTLRKNKKNKLYSFRKY